MSKINLCGKEFALFLTADKIQAEVQRIADRINTELNSEDVVFLGILNGAFMFASDLLRKINFDVQVTFVKLTSYSGQASTGIVKRLIGVNEDLKDKTVVIVEDIIDTGATIESIIAQIKGFQAAADFCCNPPSKTRPLFERNKHRLCWIPYSEKFCGRLRTGL